jgi:hypothetical protein
MMTLPRDRRRRAVAPRFSKGANSAPHPFGFGHSHSYPQLMQRTLAKMPRRGSRRPWRLYQNYALDIILLRFGKIDDGVMQYS